VVTTTYVPTHRIADRIAPDDYNLVVDASSSLQYYTEACLAKEACLTARDILPDTIGILSIVPIDTIVPIGTTSSIRIPMVPICISYHVTQYKQYDCNCYVPIQYHTPVQYHDKPVQYHDQFQPHYFDNFNNFDHYNTATTNRFNSQPIKKASTSNPGSSVCYIPAIVSDQINQRASYLAVLASSSSKINRFDLAI
jgi:hypothetical protein